MRNQTVACLFVAAALLLFHTPGALAIPEDQKFLDREMLVETLTVEDEIARDLAAKELLEAEMKLQDAIDTGAPEEEIEELEMAVEAAGERVTAIEQEIDRTEMLVDEMSDAQVFAMNRNFNSAISSGLLPLFVSADDLAEVVARDFDKRQINAFARSFMHRARFDRHAARFEAKAEATGDARFEAKAERADAKGEEMFDRVQSKIDRFDGGAASGQSAGKDAAKSAARDAAQQAAKAAAAEENRRGAPGAGKSKGNS